MPGDVLEKELLTIKYVMVGPTIGISQLIIKQRVMELCFLKNAPLIPIELTNAKTKCRQVKLTIK